MANKLFGTDGVRGTANTYPMDINFATKLALILSDLVCREKKKIAIGKDTRLSGDMIEAALSAGFMSKGVSVVSLGVVPTPLVTKLTPSLDVDLSLMITASHNPYQDNGIKLINAQGDKFSDDFYARVEELISSFESIQNSSNSLIGKIIKNNSAVEDYISIMRNIAPNFKALQGLKVVIDCANGAFSYILPQTFKDLGAGVITINNTPDGVNINKNCGSQHPEGLSKIVVDTHAHFGIAVDGDGDRIIIVDDKGTIVDGDQILCFLALYMKKHNILSNNTVISTEWSNLGLGEYLLSNGFNYFKSKVGERYVIDLMKENNASLGGEVVGHIVLSKYAQTGDALATAIVFSLAYLEENKPLSDIFPIFTPFPCIVENIRFSDRQYMIDSVEHDDVKQALIDAKELLGSPSTLIARKSGTEPVIKLRVEGQNADIVQDIAEKLKKLILQYQK